MIIWQVFIILAADAPSDLNLDLPNQWLWDIIDEFIYQYQAFCQYRTKLKNKPVEELNLLKNNPQVFLVWKSNCAENEFKLWNVNTVINYLQALVTKSNIVQILEREKSGNHAYDLHRKFNFSKIQLEMKHQLFHTSSTRCWDTLVLLDCWEYTAS